HDRARVQGRGAAEDPADARQAARAALDAAVPAAVSRRRRGLPLSCGRGAGVRGARAQRPRGARAAGRPLGLLRARRRIQSPRGGVPVLKTILITGAAGDVGTHLRRELQGKYRIVASDLRDLKEKFSGQSFKRADISEMSDAVRITKG